MLKVSVIIPTYNRSAYLKLAIESILNQSYTNFEIIITDNASTDDTETVVKAFNSDKIKFFKNLENYGVVRNHNIAIEKSSGQYIHIFSDDDLMEQNSLEAKVKILDELQNVGLVHSNINTINADGEIIDSNHWARNYFNKWQKTHSLNSIFTGKYYLKVLYSHWNIISMPSVMIRRNLLEKTGVFDNNTHFLCDWHLWMRLCLFCDIYYLNDKYVKYRIHTSNTISDSKEVSIKHELHYIKADIQKRIKTENINIKLESKNIKKESLRQIKRYPIKPSLFLSLMNKMFNKIKNL